MTHTSRAARRVDVCVPAKINLFLAVRGVRDDGYHELVTVLQTVSLRDRVSASLEGDLPFDQHPSVRRRMRISLDHDGTPGVPDGGDNLVVRAAALLGERLGMSAVEAVAQAARVQTTRLAISKTIPVAGGMAGGSADAAGALVALNLLWGGGLDVDELRELGSQLGSDVPFCLAGGTALATGRGTAVAQVLCRGAFHWAVGRPDGHLSTPEVYQAWDAHERPSTMEPDAILAALSTGDAEALGAALVNDLQPAALRLRPDLADGLDALRGGGALGAVVSGSGPTVLGLARSADHAVELADAVAEVLGRSQVASSPAGGPELLR